jgi:hypothetical protein
MSGDFINWTSRVAIAGRIAKWRRQPQGWNETKISGDEFQPFGKAEARAQAAKWFWQP